MPRKSAEAQSMVELRLEGQKLAPPASLTEEQARFWHDLVDPFPANRFAPDQIPVLLELVRHMARSAQVNQGLDQLRKRDLNGINKRTSDVRNMFAQLASIAREEAKLIASLSGKLYLTLNSQQPIEKAERVRRVQPTLPPPWQVDEAPEAEPAPVPWPLNGTAQ